ncbi:hypothetical protein MJO28_013262 [Puccinia striiformis f. sp. tritici]|uniref:Uncharacterized protein n=1 Tax=Puccinia striiformis f. sp. tritici TaxID=168172 RepID=A0ACC0E0Q7_9BASI|nr:hypothetical protein MJO28_013262 [Puccinia striiformis f. sp. tritici]KAI7942990.1 hypothetical protein MJO29_012834 [Puccinia striiformis f. sp. tritici]
MENDGKEPADSYQIPPEYQVYLDPNFDPQEFANSVLNKEAYHSTDTTQFGSGDVSGVLTKLNQGIEDITKQIRSQVTTHHLKLLKKASSVASLEQPLQSVKNALLQLESNLEKLHKKIGNRHSTLEDALNRLDRYQAAAELSRRTSRFVTLAKRLETQMAELNEKSFQDRGSKTNSENDTSSSSRDQHQIILAESALTLSELEKLLDSELESAISITEEEPPNPSSIDPISQQTACSIRALKVIQPHVQAIVAARKKVEEQMSKILNQGLVQLDRPMLSSSFQTAYNLSILDRSVGSLIFDLTDLISKKIKLAFDLNALAKEAGANDPQPTSSFGYKSRARTEPTPSTLPHWTSTLWTRLEGMIDDLSTSCVKVYTLEKVLEWKKDPITGLPFLEVVTSTGSMLEERPSTVFWTTLSSALSKETRETLRTSNFIAQTLTTNYPHLLRLFQEFFARISIHTSTTYNTSFQSPETILTLRAILPLENIYLNRSVSKMNEAANSGRVDKLTTTISNELDAARFDPLLLRSVTKKSKEVVENYLKRIESRIMTDYQSISLVGPVATTSQITNMEIYNTLSDLSRILVSSIEEYPEEIKKIIDPTIELTEKIRSGIIDPLVVSTKRDLNMIISKMHNQSRPPPSFNSTTSINGAGIYMQELRSKLNLIRNEILARLLDPIQVESILVDLTVEILNSFLFHASLITPLTESVKIRLAGDLAELEFEVSQFLVLEQGGRRSSSTSTTLLPVPQPIMTNNGNNDNDDDDDRGRRRSRRGSRNREEGRMVVTEQLDNLKIFRQLLFTDRPTEVEELIRQSSLDRLPIIHHLIVKHQSEPSSINNNNNQILLIHQRNSWSQAEYFRWVQEYIRSPPPPLHLQPSPSSSPTRLKTADEPVKILKAYLDEFFDAHNHPALSAKDYPQNLVNFKISTNAIDSSDLQWLVMARLFIN